MKTLIYQFWTGDMPPYAAASRSLFQDYAKRIGADYRFDQDPDFFRGKHARYHHAVRPIFDTSFHAYDRVLFVDMDVFPVEGLDRDVFEEPVEHIALVQEINQDEVRSIRKGNITLENDRRWADYVDGKWGLTTERGREGTPAVFNSGVILYSKEGMKVANRIFPKPWSYVLWMSLKKFPTFYRLDQNYLSAFVFRPGLEFSRLHNDWNSQIQSINLKSGGVRTDDLTTKSSALVHFQYHERNAMAVDDILDMINAAKRS